MKESGATERSCVLTRHRAPPEGLIRFVRGPDGAIVPDIRRRLPGRGVWVTARADLVAEAAKRQLFSKSLKQKALAAPDLAAQVDRLLEIDCLQMLALANKAGLAVAGFAKVAALLEKGAASVLLEAADGGGDGRRKLAQVARRMCASGAPAPPVVAIFASAQLDLALGRVNVIHAALATGAAATGLLARCRRLADYRGVVLAGADAARGGPLDEDPPNDDPPSAARAGDRDFDANGPGAARGSETE